MKKIFLLLFLLVFSIPVIQAQVKNSPQYAIYLKSIDGMQNADYSFQDFQTTDESDPENARLPATKTCSQRCSKSCSVSCTTTRGCSSRCKSYTDGCQGSTPTPTTDDRSKVQSQIVSVEAAKSINVYVTKSGSKYHKLGCSYLSKSSSEITLDKAVEKNLEPCSKCKPPIIGSSK